MELFNILSLFQQRQRVIDTWLSLLLHNGSKILCRGNSTTFMFPVTIFHPHLKASQSCHQGAWNRILFLQ